MDFTHIQQAWQQQAPQTQKEDDQMITDVMNASRQLGRRVKVRDFSEIAAAVGVSGVFAWMGWQAPVTWPWMVAAAINLGVALIFGRERWRAARAETTFADVRTALTAALAEADRQVALISSVVRWYLAPLFVAMLFAGLGMVLATRAELGPDAFQRSLLILVPALVVVAGVVIGTFVYVSRMNARAVTTELVPHRERLAAALAELDHSGQ